MKLSLIGVLMILVLTACGGGGNDVDLESVAKSLETAFNARDMDTLVSLFAEDGLIEMPLVPGVDSSVGACNGTSKDCWQDFIDTGFTWRFSNFVTMGTTEIRFTHEIDTGDGTWDDYGQFRIQFKGDKISWFH